MDSVLQQPIVDAPSEKKEKISLKTMLFYGIGQTGGQLFRDCPATLLPLFMTTILAVSPWLAGIVVLVPKLWLIVCDPVMGAYSDRLKPRVSRRPFLLVGGVLTGIAFVALFSFSNFGSPLIAAVVIGGLFFLGSTAFSTFSVPYLALASELSDDAHERTKVLSFRILFTVLGVILGFGIAQPLVFKLGGDAEAWQFMGLVFGGICLVTMSVTALGLPKNYGTTSDGSVAALSFKNYIAVVRSNKPFAILTTAYFFQSIAQSCGFAVVGFVFIYALGDINLLLPFILVMAFGSISSQPMWVKLSKYFGKVFAFWIACIIWLGVTFTWLWVGSGGDVIATVPFIDEFTQHKLFVLLRAFIVGVSNAGFSLLSYSILTDTIEEQKNHGKLVDEGLFSGIFTAIEKLAFALGPLVTGVVLSYQGFKSSYGGAVAQSESAISGMVWCYSLVPAFFMILSLAVFSRYRLFFSR